MFKPHRIGGCTPFRAVERLEARHDVQVHHAVQTRTDLDGQGITQRPVGHEPVGVDGDRRVVEDGRERPARVDLEGFKPQRDFRCVARLGQGQIEILAEQFPPHRRLYLAWGELVRTQRANEFAEVDDTVKA